LDNQKEKTRKDLLERELILSSQKNSHSLERILDLQKKETLLQSQVSYLN